MIRKLFLADDGRPALYWRLFGYFVAWFVVMQWTSSLRVDAVKGPNSPSLPGVTIYALLFMTGVAAVTWLFRRWVDRRPWRSMALPVSLRSLGELAAGMLLALIMTFLVFLGLRAAGAVEVAGYEPDVGGLTAALLYSAVFLIARFPDGFCEEILFRGYWIQNLAETRAVWRPALGIGLVFGLLHIGKATGPMDNLILVFTAVVLTCFLVAGRLLTGSLWLPIGWHAAWNWAEVHLFGLPGPGGPDYGHAFIHLNAQARVGALEYETLTLLLELAAVLAGLGGMLLWGRLSGRPLPWRRTLDPEGQVQGGD